MRLELTRVGLLVELVNHYTTRVASGRIQMPLSNVSIFFTNLISRKMWSVFSQLIEKR